MGRRVVDHRRGGVVTCTHEWVIAPGCQRCRHCGMSTVRRAPIEVIAEAKRNLKGVRCSVCDTCGGFPQESFQGAVMHDGCAADLARDVTGG